MDLNVSVRTDTGKGVSRKYRNSGKIPGIVYGSKKEPVSVLIDNDALVKFIKSHGTSTLVNLSIEGDRRMVLFKEISRDVRSRKLIHVDFQEVDQKKEVTRELSLNFVGTPQGVASQGGALMILNREIEITCLPKDIPEKALEVNIESLALNESIHASDLTLPPAVKLESPEDFPIATIHLPKAEETPVAEAEEGAEGEEGAEAAAAPTAAEGDEKKEPEIVGKKGKKEEEK